MHPLRGTSVGGTRITIGGFGFAADQDMLCVFDAAATTDTSILDAKSMACDSVPGLEGFVNVGFRNQAGDDTGYATEFHYQELPVVTSIIPSMGMSGSLITLQGKNFAAQEDGSSSAASSALGLSARVVCRFTVPGSTSGTYLYTEGCHVSSQIVTCETPGVVVGLATVEVALSRSDTVQGVEGGWAPDASSEFGEGLAFSASGATFEFRQGPWVESVQGASTVSTGGSTLILRGAGFAEGVSLRVGAVSGVKLARLTPTQAEYVLPAHDGDGGDDSSGPALALSWDGRDYVPLEASLQTLQVFKPPWLSSWSPGAVPTLGGAAVTIRGSWPAEQADGQLVTGATGDVTCPFAIGDVIGGVHYTILTAPTPPVTPVTLQAATCAMLAATAGFHPVWLMAPSETPGGTLSGSHSLEPFGPYPELPIIEVYVTETVSLTYPAWSDAAGGTLVHVGGEHFVDRAGSAEGGGGGIICEFSRQGQNSTKAATSNASTRSGDLRTSIFVSSALVKCEAPALSDDADELSATISASPAGIISASLRVTVGDGAQSQQQSSGMAVAGVAQHNRVPPPRVRALTSEDGASSSSSNATADSPPPSFEAGGGLLWAAKAYYSRTSRTLLSQPSDCNDDPATGSGSFWPSPPLVTSTLVSDAGTLMPPMAARKASNSSLLQATRKVTAYATLPPPAPPPPPLAESEYMAPGGTLVLVTGSGFVNVPTLMCRFNSTLVAATFVDDGSLLCAAPSTETGIVLVEVTNNGVDFTTSPPPLTPPASSPPPPPSPPPPSPPPGFPRPPSAPASPPCFSSACCPPGYYCPGTGAVIPCPVGAFCDGTGTYTPCLPGTYQPSPAQRFCLPVPTGTIAPDQGSAVPETCPAGWVCSRPGQAAPTHLCPAGLICLPGTNTTTGSNTGGNGAPAICPPGYYCLPGTQTNVTVPGNDTTPQPCWDGYVCDGGEGGPQGSGACPVGYFCNSSNGTFIILPCGAGNYCPYPGTSSPLPCPPGTYSPSQGASHCIPCPPGTICPRFGTQIPEACPAGAVCSVFGLSAAEYRCPAGHACEPGTATGYPCPGTDDAFINRLTEAQIVALANVSGVAVLDPRIHALRPLPCEPGLFCSPGVIGDSDAGGSIIGNWSTPQPCRAGFFCLLATGDRALDATDLDEPLLRRLVFAALALANATATSTSPAGTDSPRPDTNYTNVTGPATNETSLPSPEEVLPLFTPEEIGDLALWGLIAGLEYCHERVDWPDDEEEEGSQGPSSQGPPGSGMNGSVPAGFPPPIDLNGSPPSNGPGNWTALALLPLRPLGAARPMLPCLPGFFCPQASRLPTPAPPGWYSRGWGSLMPDRCPSGTYAPEPAMAECLPCPSGAECVGEGLEQPSTCPAGTYRNAANPEVRCQPCPLGTYSSVPGLTDVSLCRPCRAGVVCSIPALNNDDPFGAEGANTTQVVNDGSVVTLVPWGGASLCPEGFVCPAGTAYPSERCPEGFYCGYGTTPESARHNLCPAGYSCPGGTMESGKRQYVCASCHYCPAGTGATLPRCPRGTASGVRTESLQGCETDGITFWRVNPLASGLMERVAGGSVNLGSGAALTDDGVATALDDLRPRPLGRNCAGTGFELLNTEVVLSSDGTHAMDEMGRDLVRLSLPPLHTAKLSWDLRHLPGFLVYGHHYEISILHGESANKTECDVGERQRVPCPPYNGTSRTEIPGLEYELKCPPATSALELPYWFMQSRAKSDNDSSSVLVGAGASNSDILSVLERDGIVELNVAVNVKMALRVEVRLLHGLYRELVQHLFQDTLCISVQRPTRMSHVPNRSFHVILPRNDEMQLPLNAPHHWEIKRSVPLQYSTCIDGALARSCRVLLPSVTISYNASASPHGPLPAYLAGRSSRPALGDGEEKDASVEGRPYSGTDDAGTAPEGFSANKDDAPPDASGSSVGESQHRRRRNTLAVQGGGPWRHLLADSLDHGLNAIAADEAAIWSSITEFKEEEKFLLQDSQTYWRARRRLVAMPYLPFFTHCRGFDSFLQLSQLLQLEGRDGCQLKPDNETVWINQWKPKVRYPVADNCSLSLACAFEEGFRSQSGLRRWFETSGPKTAFYLTPDAQGWERLFEASLQASEATQPALNLDRYAQAIESQSLVAVTIRPAKGWKDVAVLGMVPRAVTLSMGYFQHSPYDKRIIEASILLSDYIPSSQHSGSYALHVNYFAMEYFALLNAFAFDLGFYVILFFLIGTVASAMIGALWLLVKLWVTLRNWRRRRDVAQPSFQFVDFVEIAVIAPVVGTLLAMAPVALGCWVVHGLVDIIRAFDKVPLNLDDIGKKSADDEAKALAHNGRIAWSLMVVACYILYAVAAILVPYIQHVDDDEDEDNDKDAAGVSPTAEQPGHGKGGSDYDAGGSGRGIPTRAPWKQSSGDSDDQGLRGEGARAAGLQGAFSSFLAWFRGCLFVPKGRRRIGSADSQGTRRRGRKGSHFLPVHTEGSRCSAGRAGGGIRTDGRGLQPLDAPGPATAASSTVSARSSLYMIDDSSYHKWRGDHLAASHRGSSFTDSSAHVSSVKGAVGAVPSDVTNSLDSSSHTYSGPGDASIKEVPGQRPRRGSKVVIQMEVEGFLDTPLVFGAAQQEMMRAWLQGAREGGRVRGGGRLYALPPPLRGPEDRSKPRKSKKFSLFGRGDGDVARPSSVGRLFGSQGGARAGKGSFIGRLSRIRFSKEETREEAGPQVEEDEPKVSFTDVELLGNGEDRLSDDLQLESVESVSVRSGSIFIPDQGRSKGSLFPKKRNSKGFGLPRLSRAASKYFMQAGAPGTVERASVMGTADDLFAARGKGGGGPQSPGSEAAARSVLFGGAYACSDTQGGGDGVEKQGTGGRRSGSAGADVSNVVIQLKEELGEGPPRVPLNGDIPTIAADATTRIDTFTGASVGASGNGRGKTPPGLDAPWSSGKGLRSARLGKLPGQGVRGGLSMTREGMASVRGASKSARSVRGLPPGFLDEGEGEGELQEQSDTWRPHAWKRSHFVVAVFVVAAFNVALIEFSFTDVYGEYFFVWFLCMKMCHLLLERAVSSFLAEELLVVPISICINLTEALVTIAADSFTDFTLGYFLGMGVRTAEYLYLSMLWVYYKNRLWPKLHVWAKATANAAAHKYHRMRSKLRGTPGAQTDFPVPAAGRNDALFKPSMRKTMQCGFNSEYNVEDMIAFFTVHGVATSTMLLLPAAIFFFYAFNPQLQLSFLLEIRRRDLLVYLLFAIVIIGFELLNSILWYNIQELFKGWGVFQYMLFARFRFDNRTTWWKGHEGAFDESLEPTLRSIDQLCFSWQHFAAVSLGGCGAFLLVMCISMLLRGRHNLFQDPLFLPMTALMLLVCYLTSCVVLLARKPIESRWKRRQLHLLSDRATAATAATATNQAKATQPHAALASPSLLDDDWQLGGTIPAPRHKGVLVTSGKAGPIPARANGNISCGPPDHQLSKNDGEAHPTLALPFQDRAIVMPLAGTGSLADSGPRTGAEVLAGAGPLAPLGLESPPPSPRQRSGAARIRRLWRFMLQHASRSTMARLALGPGAQGGSGAPSSRSLLKALLSLSPAHRQGMPTVREALVTDASTWAAALRQSSKFIGTFDDPHQQWALSNLLTNAVLTSDWLRRLFVDANRDWLMRLLYQMMAGTGLSPGFGGQDDLGMGHGWDGSGWRGSLSGVEMYPLATPRSQLSSDEEEEEDEDRDGMHGRGLLAQRSAMSTSSLLHPNGSGSSGDSRASKASRTPAFDASTMPRSHRDMILAWLHTVRGASTRWLHPDGTRAPGPTWGPPGVGPGQRAWQDAQWAMRAGHGNVGGGPLYGGDMAAGDPGGAGQQGGWEWEAGIDDDDTGSVLSYSDLPPVHLQGVASAEIMCAWLLAVRHAHDYGLGEAVQDNGGGMRGGRGWIGRGDRTGGLPPWLDDISSELSVSQGTNAGSPRGSFQLAPAVARVGGEIMRAWLAKCRGISASAAGPEGTAGFDRLAMMQRWQQQNMANMGSFRSDSLPTVRRIDPLIVLSSRAGEILRAWLSACRAMGASMAATETDRAVARHSWVQRWQQQRDPLSRIDSLPMAREPGEAPLVLSSRAAEIMRAWLAACRMQGQEELERMWAQVNRPPAGGGVQGGGHGVLPAMLLAGQRGELGQDASTELLMTDVGGIELSSGGAHPVVTLSRAAGEMMERWVGSV
eukprot:jgi/Mesvir1/18085/Mv09386-RA.1